MTQLPPHIRAFLEERRFAVLGTLNADGTIQQSVMWYELRGDQIMMNTRRGRVKDRNMLRDLRVSLCFEDEARYVTITGRIEFVADPETAQADIKALAPDCVERDGKYYFYFCANHDIGVAVSDSPTGPFQDALGRPLIENAQIKTFSIDPHVLIDDDGQAYLYFGNGTPTVYRLNRDMISFNGPPVEFELKEFREGTVVFKRAGKYYFMWSIDDARSPDYRLGWGVADSPFGPVVSPAAEEDFIVLRQNGAAVATAHHGVVNVPGTDRWYVAYHRHAVPGGSGYKREVCLVRMEFNADGSIKPMDPLTVPFNSGDVGEPLVHGRGRP